MRRLVLGLGAAEFEVELYLRLRESVFAQALINASQREVRFWIGGVKARCALILEYGLRQISLVLEDVAEIEMGHGNCRIEPDGLCEICLCRIDLVEELLGDAEVEVRPG